MDANYYRTPTGGIVRSEPLGVDRVTGDGSGRPRLDTGRDMVRVRNGRRVKGGGHASRSINTPERKAVSGASQNRAVGDV